MKVIWSALALRDLAAKLDYLNQHNPLAAMRVAKALRAAADRLGTTPRIGRPGRRAGTFELVTARPYILVYQIGEAVEIIRVWHGAEDRD